MTQPENPHEYAVMGITRQDRALSLTEEVSVIAGVQHRTVTAGPAVVEAGGTASSVRELAEVA